MEYKKMISNLDKGSFLLTIVRNVERLPKRKYDMMTLKESSVT